MTHPTAFITRPDAILRARRAFWRGLALGVLTGMGLSAVGLFAGAWFAAGGWM